MPNRSENTRLKKQRIRCPYCHEKSKQYGVFKNTLQFRICAKGHHFVYDYELEYIKQKRTNYKRFEGNVFPKDFSNIKLWL